LSLSSSLDLTSASSTLKGFVGGFVGGSNAYFVPYNKARTTETSRAST